MCAPETAGELAELGHDQGTFEAPLPLLHAPAEATEGLQPLQVHGVVPHSITEAVAGVRHHRLIQYCKTSSAIPLRHNIWRS